MPKKLKDRIERIQAVLNKMAEHIREERAVSFGAMCVYMSMSPSALFGWKRVLLERFNDITYDQGVFKVREAKP